MPHLLSGVARLPPGDSSVREEQAGCPGPCLKKADGVECDTKLFLYNFLEICWSLRPLSVTTVPVVVWMRMALISSYIQLRASYLMELFGRNLEVWHC